MKYLYTFQLKSTFIVLDPIGVLLYYFTEIPLQVGAVYYTIYTGALLYTFMNLNQPEYMADQILEMKRKGISQREIAKKLDLTESNVSRIIKRVQDQQAA